MNVKPHHCTPKAAGLLARNPDLEGLFEEVRSTVAGVRLLVKEKKGANGTREINHRLTAAFKLRGWLSGHRSRLDLMKRLNGSVVGVEIQVSGRSMLVSRDYDHFKGTLRSGEIDLGILVVPDMDLSRYLTDRTPNLNQALVGMAVAEFGDKAVLILPFSHDGPSDTPLGKMATNLGRKGVDLRQGTFYEEMTLRAKPAPVHDPVIVRPKGAANQSTFDFL